jgi:hypothetical protein
MNPMSRIKIGLYLAAIFAAGFVTGVFVTFQVGRHIMPGQAEMAARWCKELQSKMSLTPAQVEKIRPIINDEMGEFKSRLSADMLLNLSNCNVRIAGELRPEQKTKFEEIQKKQEDMIRALFGGGTNDAQKKP